MDLANTKVEFVRVRDHLLEILGLLPRRFVVELLPLTMRIVEVESEIDTLFRAIYEASDDPERSEAWPDIVRGRYFHAMEQSWDDLSSLIDNHLVGR